MRVVCIGASAGGIQAFRQFFEVMQPDSGMAFVVALHMSAERKSMLPEIIARWTAMPVADAEDGGPVEANHVYVIPPGHIGTLRQGRLRLRHLAAGVPREAAPIDELFDSVAAELGEDAIGIVLSGTGHDGALGLKAIRARGGLTLAQGEDGSAPEHSDMPISAIATGAVDLIVPVQDMPGLIVRIKDRHEAGPSASADETDALRLNICAILHSRVGHDFSGYKEATFLRRVRRRMQVIGMPDMPAYLARLEEDREEAMLLFRDLLIGVTTFFRDADAFAAVKHVVLPRLFEGKRATDQIRVWVPGCATGEEAYSIAILLREHMDGLNDAPRVQVFATDIDERAIATARAGRYPAMATRRGRESAVYRFAPSRMTGMAFGWIGETTSFSLHPRKRLAFSPVSDVRALSHSARFEQRPKKRPRLPCVPTLPHGLHAPVGWIALCATAEPCARRVGLGRPPRRLSALMEPKCRGRV